MVQTYYLHHCKKEVKIYNYHDLSFYIHKNYLQHSLKVNVNSIIKAFN